jgi:cardiolipin synthase
MERAIREARHHLHVMFYIWNNDATGQRFRDLLVERARDGVSVRLLCDAMGSPAVRGRMMDSLRASGGRVEEFHPTHLLSRRPRLNFRNHRKILVADDSVGFVGGINIGDEYTGRWHDTAVELRGPVVDQLQEVFFDDWYYVTGEEFAGREYLGRWHEPMPPAVADDVTDATCGIVASGPHTEHNIIHDALFIAITQAQQRIYIATPYFVPERSILTALRTAVFRGVDVQIIVPAESDSRLVQWASRSYYPQLLAAGIRVFEYAPGVMHAKTAVLDDDASVVGSANMDTRSFKLNFEINCFVRSRPFCRRLADLFERDRQQSREVTAADLESRGKAALLVESLAHLLSPLL